MKDGNSHALSSCRLCYASLFVHRTGRHRASYIGACRQRTHRHRHNRKRWSAGRALPAIPGRAAMRVSSPQSSCWS